MQIVGLFCDDIRPETAGSESIIGVFPDNLSVPSLPGHVPKLALYVRLQLSVDEAAPEIKTLLKLPWGETLNVGSADKAIVEEAISNAAKNELPFAGVILRTFLVNFTVKSYGQVHGIVVVNGKEHICAVMNLKPVSTASAQPALQSPGATPPSS